MEKKKFYQKPWFLILVGFIVLAAIFGQDDKDKKEVVESKSEPKQEVAITETVKETEAEKVEDTKKEIELIKLDVRSPYRTVKTLNKDTDLPNDEILYKLPEGKYKLTTDFEKIVTLAVVKEEINEIGGDYPEELIYVSDMMQISAKPEDFKKGFASKEVVIEIKNGELLSIPSDNTVFAEKQ